MGGFKIYPNYDEKYYSLSKEEKEKLTKEEKEMIAKVESVVNDFSIARNQVDQFADMNIIGSSPIVKTTHWVGKLQLEVGFQQHGDGIFRNYVMGDVTAFLQFGQQKSYSYYVLDRFIHAKTKSYDNSVYWEYFTVDTH
jgi:hypothetical protein